LAHLSISVCNHLEVRELGLGYLCILATIHGNGNDLDTIFSVVEFLEMAFELAELGVANASPTASVEHEYRWGAFLQVLFSEGTAVCKSARKLGDLFVNLDRALVRGQPAHRQNEIPLPCAQQPQDQQGNDPRPGRTLADRNHYQQDTQCEQNRQVPGRDQVLELKRLEKVESETDEKKSDPQPKPQSAAAPSNGR